MTNLETSPHASALYRALDQMIDREIFRMDTEDSSLCSYDSIRLAVQYYYYNYRETFPYQRSRDFNRDLDAYSEWDKYRVKGQTGIRLMIYPELLKSAIAHDQKIKECHNSTQKEDMLHYFSYSSTETFWMALDQNYTVNEDNEIPLGEMLALDKCVVLVTAPGFGKTKAIVQYINDLPSDEPVIVISFRIALSEKQAEDFQGMGFTHYSRVVRDTLLRLHELRRVIIQVDSLLRLTTKVENFVLVLDEWESLVEHICKSPYIMRKRDIVDMLVALVAQSRSIIIADANYSRGSHSFFQEICGIKPRIYLNYFIRNPRQASFFAGKGQIAALIIFLLKKGKNVYVPANSKNFGKYLKRKIEGDPYLGSQCQGKDQRLFKMYCNETKIEQGVDPISDMINYQCCVATPKLQAGNSFTKDHFDYVCGYFTASSCSPEASAQLLMRVRNVRNSHNYFCVDNRISARKVVLHNVHSIQDMERYLIEKNLIYSSAHNFLSSRKALTSIHLNHRTESFSLKEPINYLSLTCAVNLNEGHKNYAKRFISLLDGMGFTFKGFEDEDSLAKKKLNIEANKEIHDIKAEEQKERIQGIAAAPILTFDEVVQLERRDRLGLSPTERASLNKYRLLSEFKLLRPFEASSIKQAMSLRSAKRLALRLLPVAAAQDPQVEKKCLTMVLNNLAGCSDEDEPPLTRQFFQLEKINKALIIGYLLSCIRALGFCNFFDPSTVPIDRDKLVEYIKSDDQRSMIEKLLGRKFKDGQLTKDGILKWLNHKLSIVGIKIERPDRHKGRQELARIESPWRLTVVDKMINIHCVKIETDIKDEVYRKTYPELIKRLNKDVEFAMAPPITETNIGKLLLMFSAK